MSVPPQLAQGCSSVSQGVTTENYEGLREDWFLGRSMQGYHPPLFFQSLDPSQDVVRPSLKKMSESLEPCPPGSWVLGYLGEGVVHLAVCAVEQTDF